MAEEQRDDVARAHQARMFRALAERLEAGEPALPTDVAGPVEREVELRCDDAAIRAAWDEQGEQEPELWVYARGRILGCSSRAPRDVRVLARAAGALVALQQVERVMLARHIDRLAVDALPRGAEALDGEQRDHIRLRVGRFRLLYRVRDGELDVVAITTGVD